MMYLTAESDRHFETESGLTTAAVRSVVMAISNQTDVLLGNRLQNADILHSMLPI